MKYRVHRFNLSMTTGQHKLEQYLNDLEGEVVAIIPNVTPFPATFVNFVLIVEKLHSEASATGPEAGNRGDPNL